MEINQEEDWESHAFKLGQKEFIDNRRNFG